MPQLQTMDGALDTHLQASGIPGCTGIIHTRSKLLWLLVCRQMTFPCEALVNLQSKHDLHSPVVRGMTQVVKFFGTEKVTAITTCACLVPLHDFPLCFKLQRD